MLKLRLVPMLLAAAALVSPAWQGPTQTTHGALKQPPIVSATEAPPGTETLAVKWIRVAVPDRGVMLAAVHDRRVPVHFLSYLFCTAPTGSRGSMCNGPRIYRALASSPSLGVGFLETKTPTAWPRRMRDPACMP